MRTKWRNARKALTIGNVFFISLLLLLFPRVFQPSSATCFPGLGIRIFLLSNNLPSLCGPRCGHDPRDLPADSEGSQVPAAGSQGQVHHYQWCSSSASGRHQCWLSLPPNQASGVWHQSPRLDQFPGTASVNGSLQESIYRWGRLWVSSFSTSGLSMRRLNRRDTGQTHHPVTPQHSRSLSYCMCPFILMSSKIGGKDC